MEPVLDCNTLLTFLDYDLELLQELVHLFKKNAPLAMAEMGRAVDTGDLKTLIRAAHSLKGSSSNLAAQAVSRAALNLEHFGRSGDLIGAREAFGALENEIQRLIPALEDCCRKAESSRTAP